MSRGRVDMIEALHGWYTAHTLTTKYHASYTLSLFFPITHVHPDSAPLTPQTTHSFLTPCRYKTYIQPDKAVLHPHCTYIYENPHTSYRRALTPYLTPPGDRNITFLFYTLFCIVCEYDKSALGGLRSRLKNREAEKAPGRGTC